MGNKNKKLYIAILFVALIIITVFVVYSNKANNLYCLSDTDSSNQIILTSC